MEKLTTSESILGHHLPNFETLDAKIVNALKNTLPATDFRNKHTHVTFRTEAVNPTCESEVKKIPCAQALRVDNTQRDASHFSMNKMSER